MPELKMTAGVPGTAATGVTFVAIDYADMVTAGKGSVPEHSRAVSGPSPESLSVDASADSGV
jgi:hypothetical protein